MEIAMFLVAQNILYLHVFDKLQRFMYECT